MKNAYIKTKEILDNTRSKYACAGETIFRTSLQYIIEHGQSQFEDTVWVQEQLDLIDKKHNEAEAAGKTLRIGREFEKALIECTSEIAKVEPYSLLVYIQKEVWLSNIGGIDYQRAVELLKRCMYDIEYRENCEDKLTIYAFEDIGFEEDDLNNLGFGYLINTEEDDEDEM